MTPAETQGVETTFSAPDITCGGCAVAIRKTVGSLDGVETVAVNIAEKTVSVRHGDAIGQRDLLAALDRAGFPATIQPAPQEKREIPCRPKR